MDRSNQDLQLVNVSQDETTEQFVVKRTETGDVNFFRDKIIFEQTNEYQKAFGMTDIELIYETSIFSITVIDTKLNNLAAIFIFNDTPFGVIRRPGYPNLGGMWETWFKEHYLAEDLNGKNSLWLNFFIISDIYQTEDIKKKIFHRVHLSLYTTLNNIVGIYILVPKSVIKTLVEIEEYSSIGMNMKILFNYIYTQVGENPEDFLTQKDFIIYLNRRTEVFPLIEIRIATQEDHDDLENIFKNQTPPELANTYENFFIAKMVADQNKDNQVLVGQVNDKAIGMLAVSTDVKVPLLVQSFYLDQYNNLLKPDFMKAVKLKRKQIVENKKNIESREKKDIFKRYKQEVMICEKIAQRINLQQIVYPKQNLINGIDDLEKLTDKERKLTDKKCIDIIKEFINDFKIRIPELDQFEGKVKIDDGICLLTDKFEFFLDTLEFFGLPRGYLTGEGHWADWAKIEEQKRKEKEKLKENYQKKHAGARITKKKEKKTDEPQKPKYFDFGPLSKSLKLFRNSHSDNRSIIRQLLLENKKLIASFFVNEEGELSETRCFDLKSLFKKLTQNKVNIEKDIGEIIGMVLMSYGNLQVNKREVMRVVEDEIKLEIRDDKTKKKAAKPKKEKKVEDEQVQKQEKKPEPVTLFEVSLSEFLKSIEVSFEYDKLLYEMGILNSTEFKKEYERYLKIQEEMENSKLKHDKTEYENLKNSSLKTNIEQSEEVLKHYEEFLKDYEDENVLPPMPESVLNAFCVKLFFIEQAFESRSTDFLVQAFDLFPDKDYLVVTQPHSYTENNLLSLFVKVEKRKDSLFNDILYIIHRESLMISLIEMKYSSKEELIKSTFLFENYENRDSELGTNFSEVSYNLCDEAIKNPNSKFLCVSAKIHENIIGIFLISKEVNIDYYDSHFNIRDFLNVEKLSKYLHGRILFYSVHTNFHQHTKVFVKELLRLVNKISFYYEITPSNLSNDNNTEYFIKDFILTRNRKFPHFIMQNWDYEKVEYEDEKIKSRTDGEERNPLDEEESQFCLSMVTRKTLSDIRIANNNKIVVVGASDTGISFIESLLSMRYVDFSNIYLIAPGGLLYHHLQEEKYNLQVPFSNYMISDLKKLLLESRIKIIDIKISDINRLDKYVKFEDNSILYYDYLVLTFGLQDKLCINLRNTINENIKFKIEEQINNINLLQNQANQQNLNNNNPGNNNIVQPLKDEKGNIIVSKEIKFDEVYPKLTKLVNIISVDDPHIYNMFTPTSRIMNALRKNPLIDILIYGRSLNLLCFVQGLLKRGISHSKIKLIIPTKIAHYDFPKEEISAKDKSKKETDPKLLEELEFINSNTFEENAELEKYVIKQINSMGVKVYYNFNYDSITLNENLDSILSYKFKNDEEEIDIIASYIVTGGFIDVDPLVFQFIHDNGLVYNGRMIIDKNFMTADQYIFAGGRLCEFSQRYAYSEKGKLLRLECYNSREVGFTLAKSFLQTIDSQLNIDNSISNDNKTPSFYLPIGFGCYLPNDMLYYRIKSVKETITVNKELT
jgi:hypothetical protein